MKCEIYFIGKTSEKYLNEGIELYLKRLRHYMQVELKVLSASSLRDPIKAVQEEGDQLLRAIKPGDFLVVLDEAGTALGSEDLAQKIQKWSVQGVSKLIFVTGGAYGLSQSIKAKASFILSASKFTFTHQMIRLILIEQLYRAMTILKNESYHHG